MDNRAARKVVKRVGIKPLNHGDVVRTPRGEILYANTLIIPGRDAYAFFMDNRVIGIVIAGGGRKELRYCDREGLIHAEEIVADTRDQVMQMAVNRMAAVTSQMLGERHPLAEAASANARPA